MSDWTEKRHEAARAACENATEGPWAAAYEYSESHPYERYVYAISGPTDEGIMHSSLTAEFKAQYGHEITDIAGIKDADAEFIALSRTELPAALDEIERLREEIAVLQEGCEWCVG